MNGVVLVVTLLLAAEPLKFYFVVNSSWLLSGFFFLNFESVFYIFFVVLLKQ